MTILSSAPSGYTCTLRASCNNPPFAPAKWVKQQYYRDPSYFAAVDNHAKAIAAVDTYDSIEELFYNLFELKKSSWDELSRLRCLFRFVTLKGPEQLKIRHPPDTSSQIYGQMLSSGAVHATMFHCLCSFAQIISVVVPGRCKGIRKDEQVPMESTQYVVGAELSSSLAHNWNAVYVNDSWQLLDPLWSSRVVRSDKHHQDQLVHEFDEFYFLTDPHWLIYSHLPDEASQQLLSRPLSGDEFVMLPVAKNRFFTSGLSFCSHNRAVIHAADAHLKIVIGCSRSLASSYRFVALRDRRTDFDGIQLARFVFQQAAAESLTFYVRVPFAQEYLFTVFIADEAHTDHQETRLCSVCEYRIVSDKATAKPEPYPDFPNACYGMTPELLKNNIDIECSKLIGAAVVTSSADVEMLLKHPTGANSLGIGLALSTADGEQVDAVETTSTAAGTLASIRIPKKGEYVAQIYAYDRSQVGSDELTAETIGQYLVRYGDPLEMAASPQYYPAVPHPAMLKDFVAKEGVDIQQSYSQEAKKAMRNEIAPLLQPELGAPGPEPLRPAIGASAGQSNSSPPREQSKSSPPRDQSASAAASQSTAAGRAKGEAEPTGQTGGVAVVMTGLDALGDAKSLFGAAGGTKLGATKPPAGNPDAASRRPTLPPPPPPANQSAPAPAAGAQSSPSAATVTSTVQSTSRSATGAQSVITSTTVSRSVSGNATVIRSVTSSSTTSHSVSGGAASGQLGTSGAASGQPGTGGASVTHSYEHKITYGPLPFYGVSRKVDTAGGGWRQTPSAAPQTKSTDGAPLSRGGAQYKSMESLQLQASADAAAAADDARRNSVEFPAPPELPAVAPIEQSAGPKGPVPAAPPAPPAPPPPAQLPKPAPRISSSSLDSGIDSVGIMITAPKKPSKVGNVLSMARQFAAGDAPRRDEQMVKANDPLRGHVDADDDYDEPATAATGGGASQPAGGRATGAAAAPQSQVRGAATSTAPRHPPTDDGAFPAPPVVDSKHPSPRSAPSSAADERPAGTKTSTANVHFATDGAADRAAASKDDPKGRTVRKVAFGGSLAYPASEGDATVATRAPKNVPNPYSRAMDKHAPAGRMDKFTEELDAMLSSRFAVRPDRQLKARQSMKAPKDFRMTLAAAKKDDAPADAAAATAARDADVVVIAAELPPPTADLLAAEEDAAAQLKPDALVTTLLEDYASHHKAFQAVDQYAYEVTQVDHATFRDLVWNLIYAPGIVDDLERVRALFLWLCNKNLDKMKFDSTPKSNSPEEVLMKLRKSQTTYAETFEMLCRHAGLQAVTISGYVKGSEYRPGASFQDGSPNHAWNAVLIGGKWRLFDCHWGARRIAGPQAQQQLEYELDEFYFGTAPKQLIYTHLPLDPQWQLLEQPIGLRDFERIPSIKSPFFKFGLEMVSHRDVRITCAGSVNVQIGFQRYRPSQPGCSIAFTLQIAFDDGRLDALDGRPLSQFGLHEIVDNLALFRLRFPIAANYVVRLYAKEMAAGEHISSGTYQSIIEYCVTVTELDWPIVPFPPCTGSVWGLPEVLNTYHVEASINQALLFAHEGQIELRLKLSVPMRFSARLHSVNHSDDDLACCILYRQLPMEAVFTISLPSAGEFGLELFAAEDRSEGAVAEAATSGRSVTELLSFAKWLVVSSEPPAMPLRFPAKLNLGPQRSMTGCGLAVDSHPDPLVICDHRRAQIRLKLDRPLSVLVQLTDEHNKDLSANSVLQQRMPGAHRLELHVRLPRDQQFFKLQLFAKPLNVEGSSLPNVFNYLLACINPASEPEEPNTFPTQLSAWRDNECFLLEPQSGLLTEQLAQTQAGEKAKGRDVANGIRFRVVAAGFARMSVVINGRWTTLNRAAPPAGVSDSATLFENWVAMEPGFWSAADAGERRLSVVAAKTLDGTQFSTLLQFNA